MPDRKIAQNSSVGTATIVFARDQHVISDAELAQYPWSCIGRVEAAPQGSNAYVGVGSGTLVGPRMILTASHIFEVRPFGEYSYRFAPGYKAKKYKKTAGLTGRFVTGNPSGNPAAKGLINNVNGWDFVVCEIDIALGSIFGEIGVQWGDEDFYKSNRWTSVGYPQGLGGDNPIRFPGIDISHVDKDKYSSREIQTDDYVFEDFFPGGQTFSPGWSGGPLLGLLDDGWWVVGVMSGREPDGIFDAFNGENVFAGGPRLIQVHSQANLDWFPTRALVPEFAHVAAVSRSRDKLDLFVTDVQGKVRTASWEPGFSGWAGWRDIRDGSSRDAVPLDAVSRSSDKLDIFVVAGDQFVYGAAWDPAFTDSWHGWWNINNFKAPGFRVAAVSRRPDTLDIFAVGTDGRVWTAAWDPSVTTDWRGWWPIGDLHVPFDAHIHVVSRSLDKLDVFVTDVKGKVRTAAWDPAVTNDWRGWWEINGGESAPGSPVTAVSRSNDKLDIFITGTDGHVWTAAWDPGITNDWRGWSIIGDIRLPKYAPVHVVSRSADKLDIFATDVDGKICTAAWDPGFTEGWHGWWEINGGRAMPGAPVTVVSRSRDKLDAFVVGSDQRVWTASWEPAFTNGWQGWRPIGV